VQVNTPPGVMPAPPGAPASRLKVSVWPGTSGSLAVAVKGRRGSSLTVLLPVGGGAGGGVLEGPGLFGAAGGGGAAAPVEGWVVAGGAGYVRRAGCGRAADPVDGIVAVGRDVNSFEGVASAIGRSGPRRGVRVIYFVHEDVRNESEVGAGNGLRGIGLLQFDT